MKIALIVREFYAPDSGGFFPLDGFRNLNVLHLFVAETLNQAMPFVHKRGTTFKGILLREKKMKPITLPDDFRDHLFAYKPWALQNYA